MHYRTHLNGICCDAMELHTQFYGWCIHVCRLSHFTEQHTLYGQSLANWKHALAQVNLSMFGRSGMSVYVYDSFNSHARYEYKHREREREWETRRTHLHIVQILLEWERKRNKQKAHNNIISLMIYVIPLERQAKTIVSSHSAKLLRPGDYVLFWILVCGPFVNFHLSLCGWRDWKYCSLIQAKIIWIFAVLDSYSLTQLSFRLCLQLYSPQTYSATTTTTTTVTATATTKGTGNIACMNVFSMKRLNVCKRWKSENKHLGVLVNCFHCVILHSAYNISQKKQVCRTNIVSSSPKSEKKRSAKKVNTYFCTHILMCFWVGCGFTYLYQIQ